MPKKAVRPLRARQSFHASGRFVSRGTLVRSDDDVVAGREDLFEDILERLNIVEQATAAPGEKRARKPRATKKADEADDDEAAGGGS